jgi:hypothetical protein
MKFKVTGTIYEIKPKERVTEKFSKRELWLKIGEGKYEQTISIEFANEKGDRLDEFNPGEDVTVDISLRGRQWKDKVFNTISGFNINPLVVENPNIKPVRQEDIAPPVGGGDYLPF